LIVTFIGGGNMAGALIAGLTRKGWPAAAIHVVEIDPTARERLTRELKVEAHEDLQSGVASSDCVVLAVKPQQLQDVARKLGEWVRDKLVITIAAGIRHADLARWLGGHGRLVRAMPNTPALALAGVTGLYAPAGTSQADRDSATRILGVAGTTLWFEREAQMDAVTAVSGSGPAYVLYFIEALQEAAAGLGFDSDAARTLALETFAGTVKLASESRESAAVLRARVTSKGGTTERALAELDRSGVKAAIVRAVIAAEARSRELGDAFARDEPRSD
jgi:pyrroline-5-carboxylate reductase